MKKSVKILIGVGSSVLILIIFGIIFSYRMVRHSLPEYEGEFLVTGLKDTVKIYRDSFAVPYIITGDEEDAAFALGFVHAQERLFQMDLLRRAGEGRLSEIVGSKAVPFDKMFKTLELYKIVEDNFQSISDLSKKILYAYSRGVNYYIDSYKNNYQLEFDVLNYDPYPWKPEHSLIIAKLMAWELNISWWTDISFVHLIQKVGLEKAKQILPNFPENLPTIIPDDINNFAEVGTGLIETDKLFREFIGFEGTHIGSNNWVINGELSVSGKPIIANDPHLAFSIPGKWYAAVIISNQWNAAGFTLPGVPGIVIGKNRNISWVLTNVMADDADFYIEELDTSQTMYRYKGNWSKLQIHKDTIKVKDSSDVVVKIRKTRRGPIISDIHPYNVLFPNEEQGKAVVSMNWTAFYPSDELFSILSVNKSENWEQFKKALEYYTVPGQNFVYGDKSGNIGYVCAVRLPIRKSQSPTMVYDGTTDAGDWLGFVPYLELPKLYNPADKFIASANNKIIRNFKYHISNIWEPPSRIQRINELLTGKNKYSSSDFKNYQMDIYSRYAEDITKYILAAFKNVKITDENLRIALELLSKWDYNMSRYSQTPAIYAVFYQNLLKNIFEDELGSDLLNEYLFIANVPFRVVVQLLEGDNSVWFDNVNTGTIENRDNIIRKSLSDALTELEDKFGKDIALWQWRDLHHLTFKHPFHGFSSLVDELIDVGPFEIDGDGTTIFNTEYSFTNPYDCKLGPSMRYIYDFEKPDEFDMILPTGQSGHIFSGHYSDMAPLWLDGEYITITTNPDSIKSAGFKLINMYPGGILNN